MAVETGDSAKIELSGSATLVAGRIHIVFTPDQAAIIESGSGYAVYLTLNSDNDQIYATAKTPTGFDVVSASGSMSDSSFDWIVMAVRVGYGTTVATATPSVTSDSTVPAKND